MVRNPRILVFGNSGSGKSTLATSLSEIHNAAHLDLDTIAWLPSEIPARAPLNKSKAEIGQFMAKHESWVIEGCYSDLLELATGYADEMIYLNLPVELCIENAIQRPWEPHKYESKELQDENLPMLKDWILQYTTRQDTFSSASHARLYEDFQGKKSMYFDNSQGRN